MLDIYKKIIWLRIAQIKINELYKKNNFLIPIHLALGHEVLSISINKVMQKNDSLILTHRNIHYNLIMSNSIKDEINEFRLKKDGLAGGLLGSMNLSNEEKNILYTSSILGNNLPVACGVSFANKIRKNKRVTFVITGDGAIEEGAFYESLLLAKSLEIPIIFIVENNEWSLGTSISERRSDILLNQICSGLGIKYKKIFGNNVEQCLSVISVFRKNASKCSSPMLIEVKLKTLGHWLKKDKEFPKGKFVNYHAGPIIDLNDETNPIIEKKLSDPVFKIFNKLGKNKFTEVVRQQEKKVERQLYDIR